MKPGGKKLMLSMGLLTMPTLNEQVPGKFVVGWVNVATGEKGHGQPTDYENARHWVEIMNSQHPHIHYAELRLCEVERFMKAVPPNPLQ